MERARGQRLKDEQVMKGRKLYLQSVRHENIQEQESGRKTESEREQEKKEDI